MTASFKKSHGEAGNSFSKMQTQHLALNRLLSARDAVSQAREEKTTRLRELRLAKEAEELKAAFATQHKGKR